jgi:hypothetical protein
MKLKSFIDHINEATYNPNDERYSKLRSLGLTDEPDVQERIEGLQEEWSDDSEITRLTQDLKKRTNDLIDKWFPTEDQNDTTANEHFQDYVEMLEELSADEMGMLEWLVTQKWHGY